MKDDLRVEVEIENEVEVIPEKRKANIEVVELQNPAYASENADFLQMVKEFEAKIAVPSIRYESLHNYLCTIVQGIYYQEMQKTDEKLRTHKFFLGFVDGKLSGFSVFYLLQNRLPHIQTIDWPYCYTKNPDNPDKGDIRIAYRFATEVQKWKKIWGARYISLIAVDETLNRVAKRLFKKPKACGTYYVSEGIRNELLKN